MFQSINKKAQEISKENSVMATIKLKDGYTLDYATGKQVDIRNPEEKVRQEYEKILYENYHYEKEQMDIEVPIQFGSDTKSGKADIVIYKTSDTAHRDPHKDILCIVETKRPHKKEGVDQLKSYMLATSCDFGVWTNGEEIEYILKEHKSAIANVIYQIPKKGEKIEDLGKFTKSNLEPAKNLKAIFRRIHRTLYSNTNISRKEKLGSELIRLIFCKIYDELHDPHDEPNFRVGINEDPADVKNRIVKIWNNIKKELQDDGICEAHETIVIDPKSIVYIVGELERYSLTKTNKDVVGAAFEIFAERQFTGDKGEFFTPRPIVKMCVEILDPKPNETIIDPACGSGGFLIYALEHIWENMSKSGRYHESNLPDAKRKVAQNNIYGIDKELDLVKICKAYMQIIGDGKSKIICADSLKSPDDWESLTAKSTMMGDDKKLKKFDIIITNPPFGTKIKIKNKNILEKYDLGHKWKDGVKTNSIKHTDPQILFIELCLNLLKDGGRMAIVLPDGIFGNPTDEYIREYIKKKAEILAIIDCPHSSFMPHTHTKTSVLIIKKWNGTTTNNYPIIMSVIDKCGHDNRGNDLSIKDENGCNIFDKQGNCILDEEFSKFTQIYKNSPHRVIKEYDKLAFSIYENKLKNDILVPRYYNPETTTKIESLNNEHYNLKTFQQLIDEKTIVIKGVGGTATSSEMSLYDDIAFLRTSDLGVFETRNFSVQTVNKDTFYKYKDKQKLRCGDILFVKDGTYRIGENIILTDDDLEMLVQSHFLIIRSVKHEILNPYLLFYLLNQKIVKKQIQEKTFVQATLSTVGNRLNEVTLPIPTNKEKIIEIIKDIKEIIETRRQLRTKLNTLLS